MAHVKSACLRLVGFDIINHRWAQINTDIGGGRYLFLIIILLGILIEFFSLNSGFFNERTRWAESRIKAGMLLRF